MSQSFPKFSTIDIDHIKANLEKVLKTNLEKISELLSQKNYTWENLIDPLDDLEDELEQFWSPISHLHSLVNSKALRQAYKACLPQLSAYHASIGQNSKLYEAINSLSFSQLNAVQQKIIEDILLDFKLSGVALSEKDKKHFEEIQTRLAELENIFENNILDATQAFTLLISSEEELAGIPQATIEAAKILAKEKQQVGYLLNLEIPCYLAVVTHADNRGLRELFYHAYVTRASDTGPDAGKFDNSKVMDEILALRHEKSLLLDFANYAEYSLASKMANSPSEVINFLEDLGHRAFDQAQIEFEDLQKFANEKLAISEVKPWDIAYTAEKMRQDRYELSQESLRAYFPESKVLEGIFRIVNKLYGVNFVLEKGLDTWHPDVLCYRLTDNENQPYGYIYIDLYARQNKRGGAWMDSLRSRRLLKDGSIQLPIASLTCNFSKPLANQPTTLTHDEVTTLFHEFGHCLHHVLTKVDYLSASGVNGVEWDAVELPSQIFENWCWETEVLKLLTAHVDSQEGIPPELIERLLAAKNFQAAMGMMRQLEFSLFDFCIHFSYQKETNFIAAMLEKVRQQTAITPIVKYNRFQHSFSHIFAGGYAAGYYSYKWSEVLSADAFSRFEEEGILSAETGKAFLKTILEVGGSKKAAEAFKDFRGRPAKVDALLRHNGIM